MQAVYITAIMSTLEILSLQHSVFTIHLWISSQGLFAFFPLNDRSRLNTVDNKSIHSCCVFTDSVLPAYRPDVQGFFCRTVSSIYLKSDLKCAQHEQPVCKNAGFTSSLLQTLMWSDDINIIVANSGPDVVFLPWCCICNSTYCPSISQVHLVLYL